MLSLPPSTTHIPLFTPSPRGQGRQPRPAASSSSLLVPRRLLEPKNAQAERTSALTARSCFSLRKTTSPRRHRGVLAARKNLEGPAPSTAGSCSPLLGAPIVLASPRSPLCSYSLVVQPSCCRSRRFPGRLRGPTVPPP